MGVCDVHVFPDFLTPVPRQLSFKSQRLLLSHVSAECRREMESVALIYKFPCSGKEPKALYVAASATECSTQPACDFLPLSI